MATNGAFEIKHDDEVYRAASMEVVISWAKEMRICPGDEIRAAGSTKWRIVEEVEELEQILDPTKWWEIRIGEKCYKAPDFETIIQWTREGRLTSDAIIEGPRTPPGGISADALPSIASFLRPPQPESSDGEPPVIMIDRKEFLPGDIETIRKWITDSRIPPEAKISLAGGSWETISECGLFEPELWPDAAWGVITSRSLKTEMEPRKKIFRKTEETGKTSISREPEASKPGSVKKKVSSGEQKDDEEKAIEDSKPGKDIPYIVRTLNKKYSVDNTSGLKALLKKKKIHSYDTILHPSLPDGECTVSTAFEHLDLRPRKKPWWLWVIIAVVVIAGFCFVYFDPMSLF